MQDLPAFPFTLLPFNLQFPFFFLNLLDTPFDCVKYHKLVINNQYILLTPCCIFCKFFFLCVWACKKPSYYDEIHLNRYLWVKNMVCCSYGAKRQSLYPIYLCFLFASWQLNHRECGFVFFFFVSFVCFFIFSNKIIQCEGKSVVLWADLYMHFRSKYAIFMLLRKTKWPFTKFLILEDSVFWIWRGGGCRGKREEAIADLYRDASNSQEPKMLFSYNCIFAQGYCSYTPLNPIVSHLPSFKEPKLILTIE